jgi:hypothetical protein
MIIMIPSRTVNLPVPGHVRCEGDVEVDGDEVEPEVQREPFGRPVLSPPVGDARCRAATGTSLVTETTDAAWFDPAAAEALTLEPGARRWIHHALAGASEPYLE